MPKLPIFQTEEEADTNNPLDNNGQQVFTTEEASAIDLEELEEIQTNQDVSANSQNRKRNRVPLTEYYFYTWPILFEKYKTYITDTKTLIVSRNHTDPSLYRWYVNQKILYNDSLMPEEHFEKLLDINFPFEGASKNARFDAMWEESFDKLKKYYIANKLL